MAISANSQGDKRSGGRRSLLRWTTSEGLRIFAALLFSTVVAVGQGPRPGSVSSSGNSANRFRTAWGHPDLQGVWTNATDTPLERPVGLAEQPFLSHEELQRREQAAAGNLSNEPQVVAGDPGTYNAFWRD